MVCRVEHPRWFARKVGRFAYRPVLNVVAISVMAVTLVPVMIAQHLAGREATNRL
jgi:hypothetical protein